MYTWATVLSSTPQCVALDMGFGMMRPNWFLDANQSGLVWNAKKSDSFDIGYHRTVMTVKDAGQGGPADDEVFTYYYAFENSTDPALSNGTPFLMHAPSPAGMVVNEVRGEGAPHCPQCTPPPLSLSRSLLAPTPPPPHLPVL